MMTAIMALTMKKDEARKTQRWRLAMRAPVGHAAEAFQRESAPLDADVGSGFLVKDEEREREEAGTGAHHPVHHLNEGSVPEPKRFWMTITQSRAMTVPP
jgi:hypothetical protein